VPDAIKLVRKRRPELMTLGINLPDGLGLSVLDSMRVDRRDTKMAYAAGAMTHIGMSVVFGLIHVALYEAFGL